tara:strand:- start:792 stop:1541 length:750 start_codon:yes stop_codon:yes gene_type:complete
MGYGMKILGANGIYQVDSDSTKTIHAGVYAKATGTSVSNLAENDLVFANGSVTSAGTKKYVEGNFNSDYTTLTFQQSVNYIVLKVASQSAWASIVSGVGADVYGVQVKNAASPSVVIFDSRMISHFGGFEVTKGIEAGLLPGGTAVNEYDSANSAPETGHTTAMRTANTIYTGNLTNQWVCMHGAEREAMDSDEEGELKHGFVYEYDSGSTTTGKIYFRSYSQFSIFSDGDTTLAHSNLSDVILGEFKS